MVQALAAGDQPSLGELRPLAGGRGLALVQYEPVVGFRRIGLPVDLAVRAGEDGSVAVPALALRHERHGLPRLGIEGDDLARGAAHSEIYPAGVVGGDGAWILGPILLVEVPVVVEQAGLRIIAGQPALRIGGRPDHPLLILGHAHGHLRDRLAADGEFALDGIELDKVAAEVAIEFPAAGKDRCERAVAQGERDRMLLGLAGVDVHNKHRIAPAVIHQPGEPERAALGVGGCHGSTVATAGRGHAVVGKSLAKVLGRRRGRGGLQTDQGRKK